MDCTATRLPYRQTGYFSKTVLDYIDQVSTIKPFFAHPPSLVGITQAIEARQHFKTDRETLVRELKKQYNGVNTSPKVLANIESLSSASTFTITTAHQNNLFTGPLYFIYKILHAIRLSEYLRQSLPAYQFVPLFYIGSEDADLAELNHIYLEGNKLSWETRQKGAVGRMKIDKELTKILHAIEGQLGVQPYGKDIVAMIKEAYKEGVDIQTATFHFVNSLLGEYGIVVLLPDNASLKKEMIKVFEDDLLHQKASAVVEKTVEALHKASYKVQANPREINLFYLEGDIRERIEKSEKANIWQVVNTDKQFSQEELMNLLNQHPERFSPNVILRGLYQETILPNIAFIGGGGELAYWLQLKGLFEHYKVPYPVLVLRNSFLVLEKKWKEKMNRLQFAIEEFFLSKEELLNRLVIRDSQNDMKLNGSMNSVEALYEAFRKQAASIDSTLTRHVEALKFKTVYRLQELEKKMLRAEKRKFTDQQRQIATVKDHLFPSDGLQERFDNIGYWYAKYGKDFIARLYESSLALEQEFVLLSEKD
jgi:bacillithiol biosynthesis cysteine-adding enzyme BshC